jgi:hypothetical protein
MELALLSVIAAVIGGGVMGALAISWRLHLRLYSLESQLQQNRNRKNAEARWSKDDELLEQLKAAKVAKPEQQSFANDWF